MQVGLLCRCQNPKRIINPYTNKSMIVPCGHCQSCRLNRGSSLSLMCELESSVHQYTLFITLTYANRYIPRAQFVDSIDRLGDADLVTSDGEVICEANMNEEQRERLLEKMYLFKSVPYLRKSDLQKFFKRLRYYVKKQISSKVRYFACGEYGPRTFRPHYHVLLYFNGEQTLKVVQQAIYQAWPFGRIDCQIATGKASTYVASYVNSYSSLPKVLKADSIRPFCLHSSHLGCGLLQNARKEVFSLTPEQFMLHGLYVNGTYREFSLWRSCYSYFFPKCKGYFDKSSSERLEAYRIYDFARQAFPEAQTTIDLARMCASYCYYFGTTFKPNSYSNKCTFAEYAVIRNFYEDTLPPVPFDPLEDKYLCSDEGNRYIGRIYTQLLLSKHFLYVLCDNLTMSEIKLKLKKIEEFYEYLDYLHLRDFMENQRVFFASNLYGNDLMSISSDDMNLDVDEPFENTFYPYFYDNVDFDWDDYKATPTFKIMDSKVEELYYQRIKHKVLNDANKIFFN